MKSFVALLILGLTFSLLGSTWAEDKKGSPTVAGKVKSIDSTSITLEGSTKEGKQVGQPQTFGLAKDVKVTEGNDVKTLADVKAGANVTLTLSPDKKFVTLIALPKKGKEKN